MYTTAAKDERLSQLLRCGAPQFLLTHLKTEREPGRWSIRRFAISFSRAGESFPIVTGTLVLSSGEDQGVSVGLEEARLWLGEEEWEPIDDEAECDAVALAFLLYVAGATLVGIEEEQAKRREISKQIRWVAGEKESEGEDAPE